MPAAPPRKPARGPKPASRPRPLDQAKDSQAKGNRLPNDKAAESAEPGAERIAKRIARAGLCSRRDAEALVGAGRVRLNGKLLQTPATTVTADDIILVDGKPLPDAMPTRLWRYHKPKGLITTNRDPEGRPTIYDRLPPDMPRVLSIGRLDLASEGLLLLTTDGGLARKLELPDTGWLRRYRVRVHGKVDAASLARLSDGVTVEGVRYGPVTAELERQQGANAWLTVGLREGKNREVRKLMEHLGYAVNRLIRVSFGPFQLGHLPTGAVEEVNGKVMREQIPGLAAPTAKSRRAASQVRE